jgi:hypothetical protein
MKRAIVVLLLGAFAAGGCASVTGDQAAASPAFTPQGQCQRTGGWWHESMNFCEYRSGGGM